MKRLENKSVIITAAGQGIGRETAIRFSNEGANVIATDINRSHKLEQLSKQYPKIKIHTLDSKLPSRILSKSLNILSNPRVVG